ncbi:MAG: hypothetical protein ACXVQY_01055 [Actinomycetota bacterium]
MTTTLLIGGARSGKSALALGAVEQLTEIGVLVLAAGARNAVPWWHA